MSKPKIEIPKFIPTKEMISAGETLFLAMANVDVIKPIVEANKMKVLATGKYYYDPEFKPNRINNRTGKIKDIHHEYLMGSVAFEGYLKECNVLHAKSGLTTIADRCPLDFAMTILSHAELNFLSSMNDVTLMDIENEKLEIGIYQSILKLCLLLIAPHVNPNAEKLIELHLIE